jgi:hypothetical protein
MKAKKVEENKTGKINLKKDNVIIPESKIIEIIKNNQKKNENDSSELKIIEENEIVLEMNELNQQNENLIVSSNQIENTVEKIQEMNCGNQCLNLPKEKIVKEKEQNQKVSSDSKEKNKAIQKKELNISKQTNSFKNKINNFEHKQKEEEKPKPKFIQKQFDKSKFDFIKKKDNKEKNQTLSQKNLIKID